METSTFNKRVRLSVFIPLLLTLAMWIIKTTEWLFAISFVSFGLVPRSLKHAPGILLSPFIHSGWEHLWANSLPFFFLSWALFFFYRTIASKVFLLMYCFTGILLWIIGRDSYHIGMSGIIYALASFLTVSGLIKRNYRLTALSLTVIFIYGSFFWGLFPIEQQISWEGHLSGAFVGFLLALFFKNQGPQPPLILSDDDEDVLPEEIWNAKNLQQQEEKELLQ